MKPHEAMDHVIQSGQAMRDASIESARRIRAAADAQIALPNLLSGRAMWEAMKSAVEQLGRIAPKEHDVVITVFDVSVIEAFFIEPHTFLFQGVNNVGENTWIGLHFSQLIFAVIHRPKATQDRIITGFSPHAPSA